MEFFMGKMTKKERITKQSIYDGWAFAEARKERAMQKLNEEERRKTDPKWIRDEKSKAFVQSIFFDQKCIYEELFSKIENRADELYNTILSDLDLDQNETKTLSSKEIFEVFDYYMDRGLNQIKNAITDEVIKNYFPTKISPYQKLFKKLIAKRAEFLIVAPKERLSLYMPYKKVKDDDVRVSLVKHLADLKIFENYEFSKKFPELKKLYDDINENKLNQ